MYCLKVAAAGPALAAPVLSTAAVVTRPPTGAAYSSPFLAGVSLPPWRASRQLSAEAESVSVVHPPDVSTPSLQSSIVLFYKFMLF